MKQTRLKVKKGKGGNIYACVPNRHRTTWYYEVGIKQQANVDFWTQAKYSVYCVSQLLWRSIAWRQAQGGGGGEASVVSCREAIITPCTPLWDPAKGPTVPSAVVDYKYLNWLSIPNPAHSLARAQLSGNKGQTLPIVLHNSLAVVLLSNSRFWFGWWT